MTSLAELVATELDVRADPRVVAFAEHVASLYGDSARAVLFYGSCLRTTELDGQMLDFYVIVSDYRRAYDRKWLAWANRAIPPNVFPVQYRGLQAKYAVLSEADFARLASAKTRNVSVWARFAQPSRLVWTRDEAARDLAIAAVAEAAPALLGAALPVVDGALQPLELWNRAFALTYSAELRAERKDRAASVVDFDPDRYRRFTAPVLAVLGLQARDYIDTGAATRRGRWAWRRRRIEGKALTLLRLAKASATYAGGVDYLAWKINRHAGTEIRVKPWQRRWPLLGALVLLPRLILRGAVR
ncbi:hypothetical protein [Parasphingopyxis marina]|uniref:Phosphatidate cytidylyltransferase n=1 Tax=Parasphingopyxis marina TaxID=2761622 RepID=A0A842HXD9_9SPHN|nr:hypothetical protein [Parasphingopyxis marina]MBC2777001.1 hypothetical protein [Parasphingopyxis marina]